MATKTQFRTQQITGSLGDGSGAISTDGIVATASGSIAAAGLDVVLGHVMAGITRIHGAADFSSNNAGEFLQDIVIKGTTPKVTIGDAGEEDTMLVFDGHATDVRIGLDDGTDKLEIGTGASMGTTTALTIDTSQQVTVVATTEATSTTDGALAVAGGLSVAADVIVGDDVKLLSDSAVLSLGAGSDVTLAHDSSDGLDLTAAGALDLISTAGSITVGAALADGETLKLGKNGAVETIIAPHGTAGSELYSVINTAGTTDGADAAGSILLSAVAGGIGLAWADDKDLWMEGGRAVVTANEDAADAIKLHADAGTSQTITLVNDAGTSESAIAITSTAGGVDIDAAAGKDVAINGGQLLLTSAHDVASSIYIRANAGTSETIKIHSDQGTGADSVHVVSDVGGVTVSGDTDHGVILGDVSGAPVTIGHSTSETTVSDNLTVAGNAIVTGDLTVNGTTVTLDTANLNVEDPFIFMGDGANALNSNSGVVFASGSNNADRPDVVFGRIANNTWALGTVAGTSGTLTDATSMNPEMSIRAAKFELSGSTDYVEFDGTDVRIISAADVIVDPGGGELVLDGNLVSAADSTDALGADGTAWAKLYVDDIDLNGQGRIDLDEDADTSIRSAVDDVINFECGGVDIMSLAAAGLQISDDKALAFGLNDDAQFEYDEDGNDVLNYSGASMRFADDTKLEFGAAGDASIEYDENGTDVLRFELPAAGMTLGGTTPTLTIGDAGAEDTLLIFDGNAQDYRIGLDDGTDKLEFGLGASHGSTTCFTIDSSHVADFTADKLSYGGTLISSTATEINLLDGGVAVGSSITIADTDGFIIDDAGTTKKIPASDLVSYLAGENTRVKTVQSVTSSISANAVYIAGDLNTSTAANNDAILDVYVNGQLMTSGSAAASGDFKVVGTATNALQFFFALEVDDVVTMIEDSR